MKHTRIFALTFVTIAAFFAACKKDIAKKGCYYCVPNDSVASNIPALRNPHFVPGYWVGPGDRCQVTESIINNYIKQNTFVDTLLHQGDSLALEYHTMTCDPD